MKEIGETEADLQCFFSWGGGVIFSRFSNKFALFEDAKKLQILVIFEKHVFQNAERRWILRYVWRFCACLKWKARVTWSPFVLLNRYNGAWYLVDLYSLPEVIAVDM